MKIVSKITSAGIIIGLALALGIGGSPVSSASAAVGAPTLTAVSVTCTSAGTYTVSWKATAYPYGFSFGTPGAVFPAGTTAVGTWLPGGQVNPFGQFKIPGTATSASIIDLPLVYSSGQYLVSGTVALPGTCISVAAKHAWFVKGTHRFRH